MQNNTKMRNGIFVGMLIFLVVLVSAIASAVPIVNLVSPENNYATSSSGALALDYNVTDSTNEIKGCSLVMNDNIIMTNGTAVIQWAVNRFTISSLTDGNYLWKVQCINNQSEIGISSVHSLRIDRTAPSILRYEPALYVNKKSTVLFVETNENATCKYTTDSSIGYSSMQLFNTTGLVEHRQTLSDLSDAVYKYYVMCNDSLGNIMAAHQTITFEVSLLPTVKIELSDPSPVKAGIIEITLTTSKDMIDTPSLSYSLDDSGTKKEIPLTGSDSEWRGYLIIDYANQKHVGAFHFSGKDKYGNTGTFIAEGKLFIIDTIEPKVPVNVEATALKNGYIKLDWYYDDEDVAYYVIYRSIAPDVDYLDNISISNSTDFLDVETRDKVTYYYKVSVVDKAENKGPLSAEVYATSLRPGSTPPTKTPDEEDELPKVLPPNLVFKVDDFLKKMENLLIDIEDASSNIGGKEDQTGIVADLGLMKKLNDAKSSIGEMKTRLTGLKSSYRTEQELDNELNKVDMDMQKIQKTSPKDIRLLEKTDIIQSLGPDDVSNAVNLLAAKIGMEEEQKKEYLKIATKRQKEITVQTEVRILEIEYLDATKTDKTMIQKKLTHDSSEPLKDVIVIETIPKSIAKTADEVEYITGSYEVIEQDPVLKWGFVEIGYDGVYIKYVVDKKVDVIDAQKAISVALLGLDEIGRSEVTGFSVFSPGNLFGNGSNIFMWIGIIVIVVLLVYYSVFIGGDKGFLYKIKDNLTERGARKKTFNVHREKRSEPSKDSNWMLNEIHNHIKSTKADVADRIYPTFDSISKMLESTYAPKEEANVTKISDLINECNSLLDESQHNRAVILYPEIMLIYKKLPKQSKAEFYQKCSELRERIGATG